MEIVEVGPRDGLQNESTVLDVATRVEFISRAVRAGARRIEAVSFVRDDLVPAMANAEAVLAGVPRIDGVIYAGLVLNERGWRRALAAGVDEINLVVSASETFNRKNQNASVTETIATVRQVAEDAAAEEVGCSVTVATAFGCPFEGEVPTQQVVQVVEQLAGLPMRELAFADTIGVGVPTQVERLIRAMSSEVDVPIRMHFHNTRNTGYANAAAAIAAGVAVLDASIGGIGGCPFAPKSTGNIATEDLVYLCGRMGIDTGLDLAGLIDASAFIGDALGHPTASLLPRVGAFPAVDGGRQ